MRPPRMSKAPDKEPSYCIVPFMLWNNWITLRSLGGQPIFARTMNSQSLLKKSFALVRSKKARKRGLCYSLYYYYSCLIEKFISMVDLSEQSAHIDSGNILESLCSLFRTIRAKTLPTKLRSDSPLKLLQSCLSPLFWCRVMLLVSLMPTNSSSHH
ncbi:hypothetical protein DPMN_117133 [Dreissena polymorpha]|uniref:Uncharacterized protein n=1 Tax=Dreissena polymorpha TaxID=45954 RepID=A0A9D4KR45_DREPO|nr:hypothetical protein DPMN_117133 [Dreissena polymorpha]